MANLERIYTIPLGDAYLRVRNKRAKRAIAFVQAFALRHMKAAAVKISEGTNMLVFRDGMQKPPRRIKVRIVKGDDAVAKVWLIGEEEKLKAIADGKKKAEEAAKKAAEDKKKKDEEAKKASDAKKAAEAKAPSTPAKPAAAQAPKPAQVTPAAQKPASPAAAKPSAPMPQAKK
ncbi:50S ribosomal protein L31e [uncultured archaeon]|nr:50S ribosomal protein L31e [uncultured archaeon]